jgi:hypothetical protein
MIQPALWMTDPSWFLVAGLPWPEDQDDAEWPRPRSPSHPP